jgi:hypothetical protein
MADQPPVYWVFYGVGLLGGALVVGIVVGLLPFFLARRYRQNKTAWFGFIACIVASLLLGIIGAAPTALVFMAAIFVRRPKEQAAQPLSVPSKEPAGDA